MVGILQSHNKAVLLNSAAMSYLDAKDEGVLEHFAPSNQVSVARGSVSV